MRVVLVTVPDAAIGAQLAKVLLESELVACVNILPAVRSLYLWEGEICDESESLLVIKTCEAALEALKSLVQEKHPYSVPELIALTVEQGLEPYLDWVRANVRIAGEDA
ncbi:MAG: divalent-cation tolerance protein CutA [Planctomycetota bacterium]